MDQVLKRLSFFSSLDSESLNKLSEIIVEREYKKGSSIFIEGEEAEAVYVVRNGKVKIYKTGSDGKEHIIHIMSDGDVFAESCIFEACPYPASAEAVEDTVLYVLENNKLEKVLEEHPKIAVELVKIMARRLRMVAMQIENLSLKDANQKIATLIVNLFKIGGVEVINGAKIKLDVSRTEMANMVGLTRETLTRTLFKFKNEGIIDIDGKELIIVDSYKLLQLV
ncbi:Crp/Fnr family transcriptional regulator [Thermobrachium celere]|uniref:Transcriptional regulator, Crp/Fnr family n=1 Tax=Thermobrachium celere DSM 8682 TaxID=941824 RepID=R7RPK3_9CLOT|nr:Crp/Fnr family transcriptional regulator [Thermobrachium celere]CDF57160.1 transcriptional regulator, Crp/Fnr family [Thermobrachium celere DSM 8682]